MKHLILVVILCGSLSSVEPVIAKPSLAPKSETYPWEFISKHLVQQQGLTEEEKINQLINYVRQLPNATFIRNGEEYTPAKAADHLQGKYKKHKKRTKTAHDFIDHLASQSKTKDPYMIRFSDGSTVKLADLLNKELTRIESQ